MQWQRRLRKCDCRYFGKRAELFQYQFVGRHSVHSGFTSLVMAHELKQLMSATVQKQNRKQAALEDRSWLAFLQHMKGSSGEGIWPTPALPFLFAGAVLYWARVAFQRVMGLACRIGCYTCAATALANSAPALTLQARQLNASPLACTALQRAAACTA